MGWLSIASCIFALIAGICLLGLGIVPIMGGEVIDDSLVTNSTKSSLLDSTIMSTTQDGSANIEIEPYTIIHLLFTFCFMATVFIHMILNTTFNILFDKKVSTKKKYLNPWVIVKIVSSCSFLLLGPVFSFIMGVLVTITCSQAEVVSNTCPLMNLFQLFLGALSQYSIVASILVFMLTYMYDFKDASIKINSEDPRHDIQERLSGLSLEKDFELEDDIEAATDSNRLHTLEDDDEFN